MELVSETPAILKLPNDIMRLLFAYCGGVARAASCSVSALWYERVLAVSQHLSIAPGLYKHVRPQLTFNKALVNDILTDYHLTVRIHNNHLLQCKRRMCIAGNQSVCELFIRLGHTPPSVDVILSRNRWFHEHMPINFAETWSSYIRSLIFYMLKHGYNDTILEYFGDNALELFLSEYNTVANRTELAHAIVAAADIRIVQWIVRYEKHGMTDTLLSAIITRDAVDLLPVIRNADTIFFLVCCSGSLAMFARACAIMDTPPLETLIEYAFESDNLILFDHLVSIGAPVHHLNYIDGIGAGALNCSLRVLPRHIDTRGIVHAVIDNGLIKLEAVMKHFQLSQEDFNYGLRLRVNNGGDAYEFLLYANNYDIDAHKQYGVVILAIP